MIKNLTFIFAVLLVLTVVTTLVSMSDSLGGRMAGFIILAIAMAKVLLVAFQFMELKLAHRAWKVGFVGLLFILGLSIVLLIP